MVTKHSLSTTVQAEYDANSQRWVPQVFPNVTLYNGPAINWVANPVKYGLVKTIITIITIGILYIFYMLFISSEKLTKQLQNTQYIMYIGLASASVYFFSWSAQYRYNNSYLELATTVSDNLMYSDIVGGTTNFRRRRLF